MSSLKIYRRNTEKQKNKKKKKKQNEFQLIFKEDKKMDEKEEKEYFLKGNGYYLDENWLAEELTRPKTLADIEFEKELDDYLAKQQEKYRKAKKEKSES